MKCLIKIQQQRQNIPPHPAKTSRHRSLVTVSLALRLSSSLELWSSVSQDALPFPLPFPFPLPYTRKISRLRKLSVWRSDRILFLVIDWLKFCGGNHQIDSYKRKLKISWVSKTIKIKVLGSNFFLELWIFLKLPTIVLSLELVKKIPSV